MCVKTTTKRKHEIKKKQKTTATTMLPTMYVLVRSLNFAQHFPSQTTSAFKCPNLDDIFAVFVFVFIFYPYYDCRFVDILIHNVFKQFKHFNFLLFLFLFSLLHFLFNKYSRLIVFTLTMCVYARSLTFQMLWLLPILRIYMQASPASSAAAILYMLQSSQAHRRKRNERTSANC